MTISLSFFRGAAQAFAFIKTDSFSLDIALPEDMHPSEGLRLRATEFQIKANKYFRYAEQCRLAAQHFDMKDAKSGREVRSETVTVRILCGATHAYACITTAGAALDVQLPSGKGVVNGLIECADDFRKKADRYADLAEKCHKGADLAVLTRAELESV